MSTLTVRLPDNTADRLKFLARSRGLSVNKLMEERVPRPWQLGTLKTGFAHWQRLVTCNRHWAY